VVSSNAKAGSRKTALSGDKAIDILSQAVQAGHHDIVEVLLSQGADPDSLDRFGVTPIFHAIRLSHVETVRVLLDHNASTAATDIGLPLTLAAGIGNFAIVELILASNAKVFGENSEGSSLTDLIYIAESLLNGREPEITLCPTPLYMACYYGNSEVVRLLVDRGASPLISSPKSFIKLSTQNDATICMSRPYALEDARWGYPSWQDHHGHTQSSLWATPLQAAERGSGRILTFLQEHAATISSCDLDIDGAKSLAPFPTREYIPLELRLWPHIGNRLSSKEQAILQILKEHHLDLTTGRRFLVAAGWTYGKQSSKSVQ
jgi:hypothetical protein